MKNILYIISLLACISVFGQTLPLNVQQPPGTYTNNSVPVRDGTANKVKNSNLLYASNIMTLADTSSADTAILLSADPTGSSRVRFDQGGGRWMEFLYNNDLFTFQGRSTDNFNIFTYNNSGSGGAPGYLYIQTPLLASSVTVGSDANASSGKAINMINDSYIGWEANPAGTDITFGVNTSNELTSSANLSAPVLISTVATGTAPLTVASTTQVANLNAATAGAATNVTVAEDGTTNTNYYPVFATTVGANTPLRVSAFALTYNPLAGRLTSSTGGFVGPLNGSVGATAPSTGAFTTLTAGSTTSLLLGTAGSAVGNIGFRNATSGTATLAPPTGALGTYSVTLPNAASTLPIYGQQITYTGPSTARTVTYPDANFTAARTDAANTFTGTQTITTQAGTSSLTGAAANMTIIAGTGNSRTMTLQTTTSGGTATNALVLNATQDATIGGDLTVSGGDVTLTGTSTITGGAGNMQITSGTGNSRTMALRTTTSGGTATTALTLGADQAATFAGVIGLLSAASPTTTAAQMAFDNNAWATNFGAVQVHNGTANTFLVGVTASDTPSNGQVPTWNTGGGITWETPSGSGTVTVVGAGSLTSTALVTGGGTTTLQTPSATATMDSSGNISTPGTVTTGVGGATGIIGIDGSTSGSFSITGVNAMAQDVILSLAAQTSGGATLTIPDQVGVNRTITTDTGTQTLTNKRITPRITTVTSNATPTCNTDNTDILTITAQAAAITSMTTNLTGTPVNGDQLEVRIKDDGTPRAITWGASFGAGPVALPTTTVTSKALRNYFEYDSVRAVWVLLYTGSDV